MENRRCSELVRLLRIKTEFKSLIINILCPKKDKTPTTTNILLFSGGFAGFTRHPKPLQLSKIISRCFQKSLWRIAGEKEISFQVFGRSQTGMWFAIFILVPTSRSARRADSLKHHIWT